MSIIRDIPSRPWDKERADKLIARYQKENPAIATAVTAYVAEIYRQRTAIENLEKQLTNLGKGMTEVSVKNRQLQATNSRLVTLIKHLALQNVDMEDAIAKTVTLDVTMRYPELEFEDYARAIAGTSNTLNEELKV